MAAIRVGTRVIVNNNYTGSHPVDAALRGRHGTTMHRSGSSYWRVRLDGDTWPDTYLFKPSELDVVEEIPYPCSDDSRHCSPPECLDDIPLPTDADYTQDEQPPTDVFTRWQNQRRSIESLFKEQDNLRNEVLHLKQERDDWAVEKDCLERDVKRLQQEADTWSRCLAGGNSRLQNTLRDLAEARNERDAWERQFYGQVGKCTALQADLGFERKLNEAQRSLAIQQSAKVAELEAEIKRLKLAVELKSDVIKFFMNRAA